MTGIPLRLRRIASEGRFVMVPMDHGVSDGPLPGIVEVSAAIRAADAGGATAIVLHKGLVPRFLAAHPRSGLVVHASASTFAAPDILDKRVVTTAEEALTLGADAISLHINVGSPTEPEQLQDLARTTEAAHRLGLPVMAMMYPRGPAVHDPFDPQRVAHAARLGEELGADIIKTLYTGDPKSFGDVVAALGVPVLVAGGPKTKSHRDVLAMVEQAMSAGAAGVSMGRNVFQHPDPQAMTAALRRIIVEGVPAKEALAPE